MLVQRLTHYRIALLHRHRIAFKFAPPPRCILLRRENRLSRKHRPFHRGFHRPFHRPFHRVMHRF